MSISRALDGICPYQGSWRRYAHFKGFGGDMSWRRYFHIKGHDGNMSISRTLMAIYPYQEPGSDISISRALEAICLYQGPWRQYINIKGP